MELWVDSPGPLRTLYGHLSILGELLHMRGTPVSDQRDLGQKSYILNINLLFTD